MVCSYILLPKCDSDLQTVRTDESNACVLLTHTWDRTFPFAARAESPCLTRRGRRGSLRGGVARANSTTADVKYVDLRICQWQLGIGPGCVRQYAPYCLALDIGIIKTMATRIIESQYSRCNGRRRRLQKIQNVRIRRVTTDIEGGGRRRNQRHRCHVAQPR